MIVLLCHSGFEGRWLAYRTLLHAAPLLFHLHPWKPASLETFLIAHTVLGFPLSGVIVNGSFQLALTYSLFLSIIASGISFCHESALFSLCDIDAVPL